MESHFELKDGMVFNVDIWLENDKSGTRYENGVLIHQNDPVKLSGKTVSPIRI